MTIYEQLEQIASEQGVYISTDTLLEDDDYNGYYIGFDGPPHIILINRHRTLAQRTAALAEELGHYYRSIGDITALNTWYARRQELLGRAWSYDALLPPDEIEVHLSNGNSTVWELAESANLPEPFVQEVITYQQHRKPKLKKLPPQPLPRPKPIVALSFHSKTLKQDALKHFGLALNDPRWDSIMWALLLTDLPIDGRPSRTKLRTYYFPPVMVKGGKMYKMRGKRVYGSIEQQMILERFLPH